jgi:hypothetical protein
MAFSVPGFAAVPAQQCEDFPDPGFHPADRLGLPPLAVLEPVQPCRVIVPGSAQVLQPVDLTLLKAILERGQLLAGLGQLVRHGGEPTPGALTQGYYPSGRRRSTRMTVIRSPSTTYTTRYRPTRNRWYPPR